MSTDAILSLLTTHGVRPTSGRILVARALSDASSPLTMSELEERLVTMDKSGIFRALTLFRANHVVHAIDSSQGTRYELCHADVHGKDSDRHVHFYCTKCQRTLCLTELPPPDISLPKGFAAEAVNCIVEGICPDCTPPRALSL